MTKTFTNIADDGIEKALRRGFTVPQGAVNLSWAKSPVLSPKNNIVMIDTSRVIAENQTGANKKRAVAYANALGILEDVNGNEIWSEEYPVISDLFTLSDDELSRDDYTPEQILPFLHVSRFFHIDFAGLAHSALEIYNDLDIKVVDKRGREHLDEKGKRRYKVFIIQPEKVQISVYSNQTVYRVHVFLDMIPEIDELYLTYNKVEVAISGGIDNPESEYKERVNPRPYFKYIPEETEVIDHSNSKKRIYCSKPSNIKQQLLGTQQQDTYGWKYIVPRKAIPDPRIFQLFRWRLACEFTRTIGNPNGTNSEVDGSAPIDVALPSIIKVGVVIPTGATHLSTRANFFFHQLNESEFNITNLRFINPLYSDANNWTRVQQEAASYWHVDLANISLADLDKFDILLWAPNGYDPAPDANIAAKISYFTENVGGTFIFETSSLSIFPQQLTNVLYSPKLKSNRGATDNGSVTAASLRLHDDTIDDPDDDFNTFGMWKQWPPNVADILHNYPDVAQIVASADVIGGWALSDTLPLVAPEMTHLSGLTDISSTCFQSISYGTQIGPAVVAGFKTITYGSTDGSLSENSLRATLIHKKTNSGGNIFISTAALFEDHLIQANGFVATSTMTISNINELSANFKNNFINWISSPESSGEMKLRFNIMLFSTINKPSPIPNVSEATNNGNAQSTTIYCDWNTSWVIDPSNGVLTEKEKQDFKFTLLPIDNEVEPLWQRVLSPKTVKQLIQEKIQLLYPDGSPIVNAFEGAIKRYFIIGTNPLVQVLTTTQLNDSSVPTAWTKAYSPRFDIPFHLGSYVTRDEMVSGGIGVGEGKRIYPPKSYNLKAKVSYQNSSQTGTKHISTVTIEGTCTKYVKMPDTTQTTRHWTPAIPGRVVDLVLHWNTDGANAYETGYQHMGGYQKEIGLNTWTNANYHTGQCTSFPYPGLRGRFQPAEFGGIVAHSFDDSGAIVKIIQLFINQCIRFSVITGPHLLEDGIYGMATSNKVKEFQAVRNARVVNGVVDSETWALIGYTWMYFLTLPGWAETAPSNQVAHARIAKGFMTMASLSDDQLQSSYAIQSDMIGGPGTIKETYQIKFKESLPIYKVSIFPYLGESSHSKWIHIDWIDLTPNANLAGYNFSQGHPGDIGQTGSLGWGYTRNSFVSGTEEWMHIALPETTTDSVIFRAMQDTPAGWGDARFLGIRDVAVYAKRYYAGSPTTYQDTTVVIPGATFETTEHFLYRATLEFETGVPKTLAPILGMNSITQEQYATYSNFAWTTSSLAFETDSSYFTTSFQEENTFYDSSLGGRIPNPVSITYNGFENSVSAETFVAGPNIGNGSFQYWTKSTEGIIDPYPRAHGYIKKDDGIKLICKANGLPYGFPPALPSSATTTMHFARYQLNSFNTDQTLYFGFYDIVRKEFVTDQYGNPEISYYDYIRRGPQNIFIAVMTTYEIETDFNIPGSTDTTLRPFKWAMPAYGVTTGMKPKIQIEPLSPDLGVHDLWPIPIRTGSFTKKIILRNKSAGSLTGYIKDYQGSTVSAYYEVPEAKNNIWSTMYGRPYTDIKGEIPIVLDDDTIKIRQYPILMKQIPTANQTDADPWKPIFQVYRRESLTSDWTEVPFTDIKDFDTVNGTIILDRALNSNDPRLVKVDYTTERKVYDLKHDGVNQINLNPYTNTKPEWIDKPLYIYLLPSYVLDASGNLIVGSVNSRAIHITVSSSIFDSQQVDYDPTAIMIGIIYISGAFDINDLIMLDTRRRGGGASLNYTDVELAKIQSELESYWDVNSTKAVSYQKGGFVIIRLPVELKQDFTEVQIIDAIERNITVGVRYQIEDLQGNRWSQ